MKWLNSTCCIHNFGRRTQVLTAGEKDCHMWRIKMQAERELMAKAEDAGGFS